VLLPFRCFPVSWTFGSSALPTAPPSDSVRTWCSRGGPGLVLFVRSYVNLVDI
jgi:hypothetical protein